MKLLLDRVAVMLTRACSTIDHHMCVQEAFVYNDNKGIELKWRCICTCHV